MLLFLLSNGGPGGTREILISFGFSGGYPRSVFAMFRGISDTRSPSHTIERSRRWTGNR